MTSTAQPQETDITARIAEAFRALLEGKADDAAKKLLTANLSAKSIFSTRGGDEPKGFELHLNLVLVPTNRQLPKF